MSHRVTTQTSMNDLDIVRSAAKAQGISFTEANGRVTFSSGPLSRASLDLKTGLISGDTDHGHTSDGLGALRQAYSEALFNREALRNGSTVMERTVVTHNGVKGVVKLLVSMG